MVQKSYFDHLGDRQYYDSLKHYQGNLLFVGISYDEKMKTHTCRIEKFIKQ